MYFETKANTTIIFQNIYRIWRLYYYFFSFGLSKTLRSNYNLKFYHYFHKLRFPYYKNILNIRLICQISRYRIMRKFLSWKLQRIFFFFFLFIRVIFCIVKHVCKNYIFITNFDKVGRSQSISRFVLFRLRDFLVLLLFIETVSSLLFVCLFSE